ncbi:MAG: hypothetical protein AB1547_10280, partial [Thermodesulfobacteriota bacterium]
VAIQPASICCLAIRPILRDRAAEFFRSSEKGSPVTPRLDRDFLTFCERIMIRCPIFFLLTTAIRPIDETDYLSTF